MGKKTRRVRCNSRKPCEVSVDELNEQSYDLLCLMRQNKTDVEIWAGVMGRNRYFIATNMCSLMGKEELFSFGIKKVEIQRLAPFIKRLVERRAPVPLGTLVSDQVPGIAVTTTLVTDRPRRWQILSALEIADVNARLIELTPAVSDELDSSVIWPNSVHRV